MAYTKNLGNTFMDSSTVHRIMIQVLLTLIIQAAMLFITACTFENAQC